MKKKLVVAGIAAGDWYPTAVAGVNEVNGLCLL